MQLSLIVAALMTTLSLYSAPTITSISWGKIVVCGQGKELVYKDAKLWPSTSKVWNWKETSTEHVPGIQKADISEFINEVDIVILTRGMDLVLQVPQETISYVKALKKQCFVGQTKEMVKLYNDLIKQGKRVGGVFHSTC
jgi:hypothetical protein